MSDYILNLLPVNEAEKEESVERCVVYAGRRTVTPEQLERATILFGWPRPDDLSRARALKWFQVERCVSGSNSRSVAEHDARLPAGPCAGGCPPIGTPQRDHQWKDEGAMKTIFGAAVLVVGAGHIGAGVRPGCAGGWGPIPWG